MRPSLVESIAYMPALRRRSIWCRVFHVHQRSAKRYNE